MMAAVQVVVCELLQWRYVEHLQMAVWSVHAAASATFYAVPAQRST